MIRLVTAGRSNYPLDSAPIHSQSIVDLSAAVRDALLGGWIRHQFQSGLDGFQICRRHHHHVVRPFFVTRTRS